MSETVMNLVRARIQYIDNVLHYARIDRDPIPIERQNVLTEELLELQAWIRNQTTTVDEVDDYDALMAIACR